MRPHDNGFAARCEAAASPRLQAQVIEWGLRPEVEIHLDIKYQSAWEPTPEADMKGPLRPTLSTALLFTLHFSLFTAQGVPEETLVKILDEKLPWYVVRIGNRVGWMHGDTLEFVNASTPSPRLSEQSITPDYTPKTSPPSGGPTPRSNSADSHYIRGPRGGCYYISPSGRKLHVDRSMCN